MEKNLPQKKNVLVRCYDKVQKWTLGVCASIFTMFACAMPTFATGGDNDKVTINDDLTTDTMIGGIVSFIIQVARYMGFVVVAAGVFMFVFAYKDDNAEAQSRAARFAVIGAIMLSLKPILTLTGLIEDN